MDVCVSATDQQQVTSGQVGDLIRGVIFSRFYFNREPRQQVTDGLCRDWTLNPERTDGTSVRQQSETQRFRNSSSRDGDITIENPVFSILYTSFTKTSPVS